MVPPAPGLFSITMRWPSASPKRLGDDAGGDIGAAAGAEADHHADRVATASSCAAAGAAHSAERHGNSDCKMSSCGPVPHLVRFDSTDSKRGPPRLVKRAAMTRIATMLQRRFSPPKPGRRGSRS